MAATALAPTRNGKTMRPWPSLAPTDRLRVLRRAKDVAPVRFLGCSTIAYAKRTLDEFVAVFGRLAFRCRACQKRFYVHCTEDAEADE